MARIGLLLSVSTSLAGCFAAPPQIISLSPNRGATDVAGDAPVIVLFDHPIQFSSVGGRFSVAPALDGCDLATAALQGPGGCSLRPVDGGDGFRFDHPQAIFAPDTRYTFTVSAGVTDLAGMANSLDHRWELTSTPAPSVRSVDPADGAGTVPADSAITVSFTRAMRESSTIGAISLVPPIAHTRVVRNQRDHARFVVFPGGLLTAGTTYQLVVTTGATDEHGQRVEGALTARITAAGLSAGEHAVVLAGRAGEAASTVRLTALSPLEEGEPVTSHELISSIPGGPETAYLAAAVSPGGRWLAVVEQQRPDPQAGPDIRVSDLDDSRVVTVLAGAARPVWSPDGSRMAFEQSGRVAVLTPSDNALTTLPPGPAPAADPEWGPDGQTLVLTTAAPDATTRIELAVPDLATRYPVPTLRGPASHPAVSPDGRQLAVFRPSANGPGRSELTSLAGPLPPGQRLAGDLQPVAYLDVASLLAIEQADTPAQRLVRVNLATGDISPIDLGPHADIRSAVLSPSRRNLAYLARDAGGVVQAYTETVQGTGRHPVTAFPTVDLTAVAVRLN